MPTNIKHAKTLPDSRKLEISAYAGKNPALDMYASNATTRARAAAPIGGGRRDEGAVTVTALKVTRVPSNARSRALRTPIEREAVSDQVVGLDSVCRIRAEAG
jgi:hypothetical protein